MSGLQAVAMYVSFTTLIQFMDSTIFICFNSCNDFNCCLIISNKITSRLRQNNYSYIIAGVTCFVTTEDIEAYISAGADTVLTKPLQTAAIDKIIDLIRANGPYSSRSKFEMYD